MVQCDVLYTLQHINFPFGHFNINPCTTSVDFPEIDQDAENKENLIRVARGKDQRMSDGMCATYLCIVHTW